MGQLAGDGRPTTQTASIKRQLTLFDKHAAFRETPTLASTPLPACPVDLHDRIIELLTARGSRVPIREIRAELGFKDVDPQAPRSNPVNNALAELGEWSAMWWRHDRELHQNVGSSTVEVCLSDLSDCR